MLSFVASTVLFIMNMRKVRAIIIKFHDCIFLSFVAINHMYSSIQEHAHLDDVFTNPNLQNKVVRDCYYLFN